MSLSRASLPLTLLLLALVLLPFGRMVEIPMGVLSILGVLVLLRGPSMRSGAPWVALGLLFLAFCLPMLFALPDAVALEKSVISTIGALRYGLSCCALLWFYQSRTEPLRAQKQLLDAVMLCAALLLAIWCLDGLLQFFRGTNILGYGVGEGYINGIFGDDDNIKFGITVALLLPLGLVGVQRFLPAWLLPVFLLLTLTLIVLSGKRAAWVATLVELAGFAAYYLLRGRLALQRALLLGGGLCIAVGFAYSSSEWVQERSEVFAQAFQERDYATLNRASGKRLPIWETAVRMGQSHWVNGVGPRGFRFAYPEYASASDHWAKPDGLGGTRVSHAHQLLLELWAETGSLGILGYLVFCFLLVRLWWRASPACRYRALPFAIALLGVLFPINSHQAWYSSSAALFLWLLVGLYLFALSDQESTLVVPERGA